MAIDAPASMSRFALALAFLALVAVDLLRDRAIDLHPVLSHPRWLLLTPAAAAAGAGLLCDPAAFLVCCAALGAATALLCERFRLTEQGIEVRGAVLAWSTLRVRRTALFLDVRTTRGQRLRLPRWMDGLGTLTRMAGSGRVGSWRRPGASWS
jgi:hypothetical protein